MSKKLCILDKDDELKFKYSILAKNKSLIENPKQKIRKDTTFLL